MSRHQTVAEVAGALVDIAAVGALAWVATTGATGGTVQITAGAIASVALGKRYLSKPAA